MAIPNRASAIIALETAKVPGLQLARAARQLSEAYRGARGRSKQIMANDAQRAAYLAVRLPATYAAVESALQQLRECAPDFAPQSVLDLGSGPGTATIAAYETFPSLLSATLIERDRAMIDIGRKLLEERDIRFFTQDLSTSSFPQADLVVCAYALNELAQTQVDAVLKLAIASGQGIVILEPGSRDGFANVLAARKMLIDAPDFVIAAPCPGEMPCPLAAAGDWCHFAARVQRSGLHRRLKGAALSYEDEKFTYVAGMRRHLAVHLHPARARIVRRPEKLKGHVQLQLCTIDGLQSAVIARKQGSAYRRARDTAWGDAWEIGIG